MRQPKAKFKLTVLYADTEGEVTIPKVKGESPAKTAKRALTQWLKDTAHFADNAMEDGEDDNPDNDPDTWSIEAVTFAPYRGESVKIWVK